MCTVGQVDVGCILVACFAIIKIADQAAVPDPAHALELYLTLYAFAAKFCFSPVTEPAIVFRCAEVEHLVLFFAANCVEPYIMNTDNFAVDYQGTSRVPIRCFCIILVDVCFNCS